MESRLQVLGPGYPEVLELYMETNLPNFGAHVSPNTGHSYIILFLHTAVDNSHFMQHRTTWILLS